MEKQLCTYALFKILSENTDEEHVISSRRIFELLEWKYDMAIERHKLYSAIRQLNDLGESIIYDRHKKGYYLSSRSFTKGEVYTLCNAIHASNFISQEQSDILISKLIGTLSRWGQSEYHDEVYKPNNKKSDNDALLENIEITSAAINSNKKLSFFYMHHHIDNKRGLELDITTQKLVTIEPRYICFVDGRPYLIAQGRKGSNYTHYRIDRMCFVEISEEKCIIPFNRIDAYEYADNNLFMFSGEKTTVKIKCHKRVLDAMIDIFGKEIIIQKHNDDYYIFSVTVSSNGIVFLAQQYLDAIEVISPSWIHERIKNNLRIALDNYNIVE
ncbi:MAG: WYL domain-containing protein [Erysipelotrichaceae bacterium]|nr:WYL domain-containing protein [Erysipelotrichaceae bacterium]